MYKILISVCLLLSFMLKVEAARILAIFPTPLVSHHVAFRLFTQELAKRGHQVYVVTAEPEFAKGETPDNLIEIDVHDAMHETWSDLQMERQKKNLFNAEEAMYCLQRDVFEKLMKIGEITGLLDEKFDLLFIEAFMRPLLALTKKLVIPSILISSMGSTIGVYETVGAPEHPMVYPSYTRRKIYNTTIWEKLSDVFYYATIRYMHEATEKIEDEMFRKINMPPLNKLRDNIDTLFLNYNQIFDNNQPVPPGVIYFGDSREVNAKELPQNLKSFMNSSTSGVVYVSFSTCTQSRFFKPQVVPMLMRVFSRLPYNVLLKWPEEITGWSQNVRVQKWFPQVDVLGHPNTKLYITQAGLQSTLEAISSGVPVIGVPMWVDQFVNAEKFVYYGIGTRLDINTVTEEDLEKIIRIIITNESYRRNVVKLRSLLNDQRIPPLQRAIWWTEYILKHGSRHLRAPAANMTWCEYFEMDLVIILLSFLIVTLSILYMLVNKFIRFVSGVSEGNTLIATEKYRGETVKRH